MPTSDEWKMPAHPITDNIYAQVERALQMGAISETWPEIWQAIAPTIQRMEEMLRDLAATTIMPMPTILKPKGK